MKHQLGTHTKITLDKFDKSKLILVKNKSKKKPRHCNKCQTTETQMRKEGSPRWHHDPLATLKWLCHGCYIRENFDLYAGLRRLLRNGNGKVIKEEPKKTLTRPFVKCPKCGVPGKAHHTGHYYYFRHHKP